MENDSEEAYKKLMEIFPVKLSISLTNDSEAQSYLKRMPYSACVPKLFIEMKDFVNNCVKFAEGLNSRYLIIFHDLLDLTFLKNLCFIVKPNWTT
jgi:hypothetical protein